MGERERERKRETRVTFQCQLYNAFYYAGPLLWGNTAMKKEEDVETRGGGRKGQKKKEIALPGFHIESLRSPGTFTLSPPPSSFSPSSCPDVEPAPTHPTHPPPPHPPVPPLQTPPCPYPLPPTTSSLTLNFLSCITGCFVFRRWE